MIEIGNGSGWQSYYIEGATLSTMEVVSGALTSMSGDRGDLCVACPHFAKIAGVYYAWSAQNPVKQENARNNDILPDVTYLSWTNDPSQNNWETKEMPVSSLDRLWQDGQSADPYIVEHNGITYFYTTAANNQANMNFVLNFYKYEGTLLQLITDLEVYFLD